MDGPKSGTQAGTQAGMQCKGGSKNNCCLPRAIQFQVTTIVHMGFCWEKPVYNHGILKLFIFISRQDQKLC